MPVFACVTVRKQQVLTGEVVPFVLHPERFRLLFLLFRGVNPHLRNPSPHPLRSGAAGGRSVEEGVGQAARGALGEVAAVTTQSGSGLT